MGVEKEEPKTSAEHGRCRQGYKYQFSRCQPTENSFEFNESQKICQTQSLVS